MNVIIVNGSFAYSKLFARLGHREVLSMDQADLVVFTGGADVTPSLYHAAKHRTTGNDPRRDDVEIKYFDKAVERELPMVGICRGGQFLNVMSGGAMYQDVEKHCGPHEITDLESGETVLVSSTHHQMMKPSPEGILVASSTLGGGREWFDGQIFKKDISDEDIEVVFYPHTRALCFQPHPEFVGEIYTGMVRYFETCLKRYIYEEIEA